MFFDHKAAVSLIIADFPLRQQLGGDYGAFSDKLLFFFSGQFKK